MGKHAKSDVTFWQVLVFASGYWRRQGFKLGVIALLVVCGALLESYLPSSFAKLLEAVQGDADRQRIGLLFLSFVINYFGMVSFFGGGYLLYNSFETRLFKQLIDDLFVHIHKLSEHFFVNEFAGAIISKINRARNRIESFEDKIILHILPTGVILLGSVVFLGMRFPVLAAALLGYVVLFTAVSVAIFFRFVANSQTEYAEEQDRYTARLADCITGIATTKAYAQEDYEIEGFLERTRTLRAKNKLAYVRSNAVWLAQQFLLGGLLVLMLGGGVWLYWEGKAKAEDLAYLVMAYTIMRNHFHMIAYNLKDLITSSYELHAAIRLLREKPDVKDAPQARDLHLTGGAIEVKDVTFTYPGKKQPVFKNFSLQIKAGERVALVGHSGSGKTTLIRLVQRLYDVQKGVVEIDGQNIAECTQRSLRGLIGLVPQDPILFHRTLRHNIAYARPEATMEEIRMAARKAYIEDFIESLPEGYDTLVGERGIKLSGGERQRIAIARAILADRPVLILDEATSSLDTLSEQKIRLALHELIQGRTSIMIAHRLSTILDADRILVFDEGRIVEQGTHAELVAREKGLYAQLFALQSGGFVGV